MLQIGNTGRFKIGSGTTDYTSIGTLDTDNNNTKTKILINGDLCTSAVYAGPVEIFDILHLQQGVIYFYAGESERMRIRT